jgi:hypothetical protein
MPTDLWLRGGACVEVKAVWMSTHTALSSHEDRRAQIYGFRTALAGKMKR